MIYDLATDIISAFTAKAFQRDGLIIIVDPFTEDAVNVVALYADIWTVNDRDSYQTEKVSVSIPSSVAPSQRVNYVQHLVNQVKVGWFVDEIYEAETDEAA